MFFVGGLTSVRVSAVTPSSPLSVSTIAQASSSCTAKTSSSSRSYWSDQRWYPSSTLISWAVMRMRFDARRTLPSSTVATLSCLPMVRTSSSFPLNAKADVRAATRRPGILVRALMTSSVTPSLKNSFSGSVLMFTNGKTAIDRGRPAEPSAPARAPPTVGSPASTAASASANAAAVAKRSWGSMAKLAWMTASRPLGISLRIDETTGGVVVRRFAMIARRLLPSNGGCPVNISCSTQPRL